MQIEGKVTIPLSEYERLRRELIQGEKTTTTYRRRVEEVLEASKELSSFLNFLSMKLTNFDTFVSTFNENSSTSEIQKVEDNKYKIKLNIENETEKSSGKD